jgi:hypothetical protein
MAAKCLSAGAERRMRWRDLVTERGTKKCQPHPRNYKLAVVKITVAIPLEQKQGCSAAESVDP